MHIKWFSILRIPPLDNVEFDCDPRVNLLIGPNGCGKSTILRALRALYSLRLDCTSDSEELRSNGPESPFVAMEASTDWREIAGYENTTKWDEVPLVYIQATRIPLASREVLNRTLKTQEEESDTPLKDLITNDSDIFYGSDVEALVQDARRRMGSAPLQNRLKEALDLGYSCAREICGEILYSGAPQPYIELDESRERSRDGRIVHYAMGITTLDDILGEPLYAGELSAGTQATLLWIWAFAIQAMNHHRWTEGWEKKPAILLIDEIENHLHPTWQRRVIPALLKHFPGLQIFATTHSPFVVAGLKAGQVHLLKRDERGGVTATTNTEDVVGWTADEILRTMMGVEDPTDDATAAAAGELRQLRNEMPLADEEAEAKRQERMQELRQKVNRDLLAGGPMAAQRELFEENLSSILEQYRTSRDLNQENN